ncbi:MAG: hypothetical protein Q9219_004090 [cf. Caloplaca sp. 3 TL-2023]
MTNSTSTKGSPDNPYGYNPSFPAALLFALAFTIAGFYQLFQYIRHRTWFLYFILLGIAMEGIGYWGRAYSSKNLKNFTSFSIAYLLIMLAPSILAAGLYQTFGRLLYYTVPPSHRTFRTLFLPARFIAPFFVIFDVVSFFIQLIGLGIVVSEIKKGDDDQSAKDRGVNILRFGLILQTLVFGAFAALAMRIILVSKRWQFAWPDGGKWKRLGWCQFRAIYRIFEFTLNSGDNYLAQHEWPVYALDAFLMLLLVDAFILYHPSKYLPTTHTSFSHAYKRLGNPSAAGGRGNDGKVVGGGNPRFEGIALVGGQGEHDGRRSWDAPPPTSLQGHGHQEHETAYMPYRPGGSYA